MEINQLESSGNLFLTDKVPSEDSEGLPETPITPEELYEMRLRKGKGREVTSLAKDSSCGERLVTSSNRAVEEGEIIEDAIVMDY